MVDSMDIITMLNQFSKARAFGLLSYLLHFPVCLSEFVRKSASSCYHGHL